MEVLIMLVLILLVPTSQDLIHWLMLVGICVIVSKFDFDNGVSLKFL